MKRIRTHIVALLFVFALCNTPVLQGQENAFYFNVDGFLDNREYFTEYAVHQTFFGITANPGYRFAFDSVHEVGAGVKMVFEFGGIQDMQWPQPDLYYRYKGRQFTLSMGFFDRREVMEYPDMLLRDSIRYYRPNMEGASMAYKWKWGRVHAWVDWMGRETPETREAIHAGFDTKLQAGPAYLEAIATRAHLAKTTAADDANQLRDDGSLVALLGLDLSGRFFLDRLDVASGLASFYEWQRPAPSATWGTGWYSQLELGWKMFGILGFHYRGDASPLMYGDPLYASGNYSRVDLFVDPFKNPRIESKIGWNLHYIPGEGLFHSQHFLIAINIR